MDFFKGVCIMSTNKDTGMFNMGNYTEKQLRYMRIPPDQPLTRKQELFCQYYSANPNGAEAARKAGYSNPVGQASENLRKPNVLRRLREIGKARNDEIKRTSRDKRAVLWGIIEDVNATNADRCRAMEILNKMDGVYINKIETTVQKTVPGVSDLSEEELKKIIKIEPQNAS